MALNNDDNQDSIYNDLPDIKEKSLLVGDRLPSKLASAAEALSHGIPCPDPEFAQELSDVLINLKTPSLIRRQNAGEMVLNWLFDRGDFIRSENDDLYYLYKPELKLLNLSSNYWRAWLYSLTGANPASTDFTYLQADCATVAMLSEPRPVLKMAAWDKTNQVLRVSRFDGMVFRLDGKAISEECNGENVIFDDDPSWKPYEPDFSQPGVFAWLADAFWNFSEPGNKEKCESESEQYRLALRVWILSTFFTELLPTRPFLAIVGVKGSGKSMTIRRILQAMYGRSSELPGVPEKPDGFTASAAAAHILAMDNLDEFHGWMRDKLARLATGAVDHYRKLYTNNELGTVHYRSWLVFTARTPETLRRDDLVDRLVILPVVKIPDKYLKVERSFLENVELNRSAWWGDTLNILNAIVARIKAGDLKNTAIWRMGDWESFGRLVARLEYKEPAWDAFIAELKIAQTDMLLEDDIIADSLMTWLEKHPEQHGKEIASADLYHDISALLFSTTKPPKDWPDTSIKFARRLQLIRDALKLMMDIEWKKDRKRRTYYTFWLKGQKNAEGAEGAEGIFIN
ncbi:MAG: hypothetical protein FIA98_13720 [Anaerolineae bacterium]|nr:hypothetical protein [Anaerolineae bacterium]